MDLTHGMAGVEPGLRLHYVTAGEGERTIVLLHGFPQTWWECHKVIPGLVGGGLRVNRASRALVEEMMRDADVHGVRVPGTAHRVPEEQPAAFVRAVLDFMG